MVASERLVLPGEEVAVAEEYEAGEGTYEDRGKVYAAQPGRLALDATHRVARVIPFNPPATLAVGDLLYATVEEIRPSMAEARVLMVHGRDRQVAGELVGSLHVSKISNAYVEDVRDAMRLGDTIRGRVIQVEPSIQLTTAETNLGVVLALCSYCRAPMERRGEMLHCPRCDRTDRRKVAADYGGPELSGPIERVPEPEAPRRARARESPRRGRPRGRERERRGGGRPRSRG